LECETKPKDEIRLAKAKARARTQDILALVNASQGAVSIYRPLISGL